MGKTVHIRISVGNLCDKPGKSVPLAKKGDATCAECKRLYLASPYASVKARAEVSR